MIREIKEGPVTEPGVYRMTAEEYHADPCPAPSLSRSTASVLLNSTAQHAWANHPKLNPDFEEDFGKKQRESEQKFFLGTAAHTMVLSHGRKIEVIDADAYRSKAAKDARDAALNAGKTPLLPDQYDKCLDMRASIMAQMPAFEDCEKAFAEGHSELVICWQDRDGVWGRTMIDWTEPRPDTNTIVVYDYKTTGRLANPETLAPHVFDLGYDLQDAFIERAIRTVIGAEVKVVFRLVFHEIEPPYMASVVELDEGGRWIGRKKAAHAFGLWARCLSENNWPGYPSKICTLAMPPWIESRWVEREVREQTLTAEEHDPFLINTPFTPPPPANGVFDLT
jgi:hypothetical protein